MDRPNDQTYVEDILKAIEEIQVFIGDFSAKDFSDDLKTQMAVAKELEIIGEASKNLTHNFKLSHPNIPWNKIAGMRNKLIHEYGNIDYEIVWQAATGDIKVLKENLK